MDSSGKLVRTFRGSLAGLILFVYRRSAFGVHQKLLLIPFYLICIFNCLLVFYVL